VLAEKSRDKHNPTLVVVLIYETRSENVLKFARGSLNNIS